MRKFDTKVQYLKYKVLRQVARHAWKGDLLESLADIPKEIIPGKVPTMRCCVYKERAILIDQIKIAMGGNPENPNVIEVIEDACDECPAGGYTVTETCRGCLAHRCEDVCPRHALVFDSHQKASIDKNLCINCGKCAQVCPFSAIVNRKRPCENACKIHAISMQEDGVSYIDNEKCISCGACMYQCPFGAISDKSYIVPVIDLLKARKENPEKRIYAIVAPSIASQFKYAKLGQVIAGIRELGFSHVVEAALGADMVADSEARELEEKGFLTSSCCPAFVNYIHKNFPQLVPNISGNLSPMAMISRYIKETVEGAQVVFIGPCTAKKMEIKLDTVRPWVDYVITFEELQALFDSVDIDIMGLPEEVLDNASYFGRIFARCGGLADAVQEAIREHGNNMQVKAVSCDGIEDCRTALLLKAKGKSDANFIEGMACIGGCVGGAGCLTHGERNRILVDRYGKEATDQTIWEAIRNVEENVDAVSNDGLTNSAKGGILTKN